MCIASPWLNSQEGRYWLDQTTMFLKRVPQDAYISTKDTGCSALSIHSM